MTSIQERLREMLATPNNTMFVMDEKNRMLTASSADLIDVLVSALEVQKEVFGIRTPSPAEVLGAERIVEVALSIAKGEET